jgi:HJR/Mrr/RecB family endonuclease
MLPFYKKKNSSLSTGWVRRWSPEGVVVSQKTGMGGAPLEDPMVGGFLTQLSDEGLAVETPDGYLLRWDALFLAISQDAYASLPAVLLIPRMTGSSPSLLSSNSLTDQNFSIAISGWYKEDGTACEWDLIGPLMTGFNSEELMRPEQWNLFNEIVSFARRPTEERNDLAHRQGWGRIRKLALHAGARLDDFLYRSVVLSPEKLDIQMRRSDDFGDGRVVEIEPSFEGAPANWLEAFDRSREVRDRYDVVTKDGITQILVTPKVRTVLQEIKRLVGRRMAGTRAQAFLLNPYATLGDDAVDVIDESQFEKAREDAGVTYERFTPTFERDGSGYPLRVGLLIETANSTGPSASETKWLDDLALGSFVDALHRALARNYQLLAWQGYDLEMQGDAQRYHDELRSAFERRLVPPTLISYSQVHDLSGYSPRVEGIGIEKAYYSPYIAKKKEGEGWFPENISPMVVYQPAGAAEPIAVPISSTALKQLEESVKAAKTDGKTALKVPWLPQLLKIEEAANIVETFKNVFADIETGEFDPAKQIKVTNNTQVGPKKQLVVRANIQLIEYEELRREALQSVPVEPSMPNSIRQEFSLMPHQRAGLAWMQHLYGLQNTHHVRGAVLGDDMGLGKTLQLLALMANLIERKPNIEPMLVIAPVSLLENWADEANKFFQEGALPMLTAYGENLLPLRVSRAQIDERLKTEDGLVKFFRPNWVGTAKVVLTTYETLRDFEFSFAAQKWSLMVCDEAQRIKNPAAMVTRAAKKQNVGFKIACTGTPVENTLADMWCLFDFVQPGLLGALNDFGHRYRKPIEAKTNEQKARVEELRARISPQILRRMKTEVVSDLPKKIVVEDCRKLPISNTQRNLYAKAIGGFKKRGEPDHATPFKNHLGLLQYLRLICTDPRPHGLNVFKPEPTRQYREKAPKLDWLLTQLKVIQKQSEKVIVFCEFREIQRLLQYYIEAELGFRPDIINGDTSASASHTASRQKRIKAFQALNGFGVLILSPVAVGFGVNIQAANHVIHYTRNWNPAKEDQATDRAYRIGQKKDVYVYYPVVCAQDFQTFDVTLDLLLAYKRNLAEDMLNGSGDVNPGDFSLSDVMPAADAEDIDQRVSLDMALRMDWKHFECLTGVLWSKRGYECYRTPGSNDNGVDVVALKIDEGQLVQAKTSGTDGAELNWDAVKEVVGGEAFYKRRHPFVKFDKVCITNQFFNRQARENAALNSVELLDQTHLDSLLKKHIVTMYEVEKMLFVNWHELA